MHGRLKVKEKAEIELEKKKKYEEKAKRFKAGLDLCLKSKANHDYNNNIMRITWDLIVSNPDVYSVWNMRKEFIMQKKEEYEKQLEELRNKIKAEKQSDDNSNLEKEIKENLTEETMMIDESIKDELIYEAVNKKLTEEELTDEFQKLCNTELELSEYALVKNAKSYSAWQHRLWILSLIPRPDFKREFILNDNYLQKDGRNLHCWHYRTNLCKISNRDLKDEIDFSLAKIKDNLSAFSYSTLYYRSLTFTEASNLGLVDFSKKWLEEYTLAEHALYTFPNDQAMWLYLRWLLLTNLGTYLSLDEQSNDINLVRIVFNKETKLLIFYFDKKVNNFPYDTIYLNQSIKISKQDLKTIKLSLTKLWFIQLDDVNDLNEINLDNQIFKLTNLKNYQLWCKENVNIVKQQMKIPDEQLKSLLTLKDLEPDNKWLNLILSYFDKADQFQLLDYLIKLDPLRRNYYLDQKSKIKLEKLISNLDSNQNSIDLSNQNLTVLYTPDPFAHLTTLILNENQFSCLSSNFNSLISVKNLIMDNNSIKKIQSNFNMINLEILSLQNNKLNKQSGINYLVNCPKLKIVYLFGNNLLKDDLDQLQKKGINCQLELK